MNRKTNTGSSRRIDRKIFLTKNIAVGVGPMCHEHIPWWDYDRYFYFMSYESEKFRAWHLRILWFYVGKRTLRKDTVADQPEQIKPTKKASHDKNS